jgi:hypothetical protein
MKGSCEYIEQDVVDSRQVVVLLRMLGNVTHCLGLGRILWNDLCNGKGVYWIHLAQDWEGFRALVNTIMKLPFYKRRGI